ncbi:MAG: TonB-dependent receptor [Desulfotignum sp.]|nr:TonB-dependent receptor [Desulfotignum sp.]MCF8138516.1 TonB-dependent receptor [Desulfotignum sp.]
MKHLMKIVSITLVFSVWAAGLMVCQASGQNTENTRDISDTAILLEEVVVTATRFLTEKELVPGRITVITANDIENTPFERVDELLQQVSGLQSTRTDGIFSLSPQVTMRGLGGNVPGRTLVLIDGTPSSTGDTGNMRWNRLNLADIERIEVFKGPGSSIYGSNAMGGVINIITKRPDKNFSGDVSAAYGTFNTKKGAIRLGGRQAEDTGFYGQIAATGLKSDGYTSLTETSKDYDNRIDRFVEEFNVSGKLGYDFDDVNSLELGYAYYDDRRGEGYKYNIPEGSHRDFDTNRVNLLYKGGVNDWQWQLSGFYQREEYYWHRDFTDAASIYKVLSDRDDYGSALSVSTDIGDHSTLILGADLRISEVDAIDDYDFSSDYAMNKGRLEQYAFYVQDELRFLDDRLIVVGGIRFDTAKFKDGLYDSNVEPFNLLSGSLNNSSWDAFSPKISSRYHFSDNISVYGSYSRGFRAPILDALCRYGIFHGRFYDANPDLENETLDSFELGSDLNLSDMLDLSFSGYYSRGKDFIYSLDTGMTRFLWGQDRAVYLMDNVSEVEIKGFEADLTFRPNTHVNFFASYTFNESLIDKFDERPELEGKRLEYVPEQSFSAGVDVFTSIVNARVVVNHIGNQYSNDMNTEEIDEYETVDVKLWRNLDFLLPGLSASLAVQNLFDKTYLRSEDEQSPGMFTMGEIKYEW